jgi:hypothetical protein
MRASLIRVLTVVSTAAVLLGLRPDIGTLTAAVTAPRSWIDRVGADEAATTLAAAGLWCVAAWIAVGLLAAATTRLPGVAGQIGGHVAGRVLPAMLVRALITATGASVVLAPAIADAHPVPPSATAAPAPAVIGWPTDPAPPTANPTAPNGPTTPRTPPSVAARPSTSPDDGRAEVTVRPGDSLWVIAARRLAPSPTDAEVAAAWPAWYAANRQVIGPDPSLLKPGQRLRAPGPHRERGQP